MDPDPAIVPPRRGRRQDRRRRHVAPGSGRAGRRRRSSRAPPQRHAPPAGCPASRRCPGHWRRSCIRGAASSDVVPRMAAARPFRPVMHQRAGCDEVTKDTLLSRSCRRAMLRAGAGTGPFGTSGGSLRRSGRTKDGSQSLEPAQRASVRCRGGRGGNARGADGACAGHRRFAPLRLLGPLGAGRQRRAEEALGRLGARRTASPLLSTSSTPPATSCS